MTGRAFLNCSVVVAHGLVLVDGVFHPGFLYFGFGGVGKGGWGGVGLDFYNSKTHLI